MTRQGPCLIVDPEVFGPEFPCQEMIDHSGKHRNGDESLAIEWLMPEFGPTRSQLMYIVPPTAADLARHYGVMT